MNGMWKELKETRWEMTDELHKGLFLFKVTTVQRDMLIGNKCRRELDIGMKLWVGQIEGKKDKCILTHKDLINLNKEEEYFTNFY